MLKVTCKIKNGTQVSYQCIDEFGNTSVVDKDTLITKIKSNSVSNAKIQDYKGQLIIRLKDDVKTVKSDGTVVEKQSRHSDKKKDKTLYAIDLFKSIMKDFGITNEEEALSLGFDYYDLDSEVSEEDRAVLAFKMASDIKGIKDTETSHTLQKYREQYKEFARKQNIK